MMMTMVSNASSTRAALSLVVALSAVTMMTAPVSSFSSSSSPARALGPSSLSMSFADEIWMEKVRKENMMKADEIAVKDSAIDMLKEKAQVKEMKLVTLRRENDEKDDELVEKDSAIKALKKKSVQKDATIGSMQEENDKKDGVMEKMATDAKLDAAAIEVLRSENSAKDDQIEEMNAQIETVQDESAVKDGAIEILRKENADKEAAIDELKWEAKGNLNVIETLKKQNDDMESILNEKEAIIMTKEQEATTKDATIDSLKTDLKALEVEKNEIEDVALESTENSIRLENELELTQNEMTKARRNADRKLADAEAVAAEMKSELTVLLKELNGFRQEKEAIERKKSASILKTKQTQEEMHRSMLQDRVQLEYRIQKSIEREESLLATIREARYQPKPAELEQELAAEYETIQDIELKAHRILLDLKMI